jgi:hypothetical protein
MVSELFFYQLALIALLWLCCMLHWVWPSDHPTVPAPRPPPTPPRRTRAASRPPFASLTTRPHCDAWVHASAPAHTPLQPHLRASNRASSDAVCAPRHDARTPPSDRHRAPVLP